MTISIRPTLARRAFGVALMLVVVLLPAFVYLRVSSDRPVHVIGSDAFGYEWQIRAIGAAKLAQIGTRPGVAGLGGILTGIGVLPEKAAPPILGLALATALGLAAGAVVRIAFALPDWAVGVVAGFVVLWGGTARMANGYLATVASLVAFAAGLALVVSRGRGHPTFAAFTCFLVACLTHPGLAPAYVGIVAAWVFLSAPSIVRERATRPWWRSEPVVAFGILVAAAALTVLLVIGILGFTVGDVAEFQAADFGGRLAVTARLVLGPVLVAAAAGGATVAWLGLRNNRSGCVLARLGLAWLVVTLAGSALTLFDPSFPGHRALLLALPLPIAAGLGVSGAVGLAGRVSGPAVGRVGVAIVAWGIGVVVLVLAAGPAVAWFRPVTVPLKDVGLMDVGAYAAAVDPTTPIVVVADPGRLPGILFWKARLNQIRAFAPRDAITRIVLYLGAPSRAVLGEPTTIPDPETTYARAYDRVSARLWREFRPALDDPASIVLAPRSLVRGKEFAALSADLTRLATPDLAVLRGPVPSGLDVLREPTVSPVLAWIGVVLTICALSAIGSGFAAIAVRSRAGHALDAAALAPAFGAVAVTLVGVSVALAGGDPTGPVGWALAGAVGAGGILTALVGRTHGVGSRVTQMLSVHGKRGGCRPR